jgi:hypothetical protein
MIDELELRVPVGVGRPTLQRLLIRLQAVSQLHQQTSHRPGSNRMPLSRQFLSQANGTLAGPTQRRHRIASRCRGHQSLECRQEIGILGVDTFATCARTANSTWTQCRHGVCVMQIAQPALNCPARHSGGTGHGLYPASAGHLGLGRRKHATCTFIEKVLDVLEARSDGHGVDDTAS